MIRYGSSTGNITLHFPKKEYKTFTKQVGVSDPENLSEGQVKSVFALSVDAFLRGEFSSDDIASVCGVLLNQLEKLKEKDDPFLFDALMAGSELGFYVRGKNLLKQFSAFMETVLNYRETLV
jgi:hypothetical protein